VPKLAQRLDGQCPVDTKPENVLLAKDGRVVLTDFGIARAVEQPEAEGGQAGLLGTVQEISSSPSRCSVGTVVAMQA
jgi:serine/threonine protein kinase